MSGLSSSRSSDFFLDSTTRVPDGGVVVPIAVGLPLIGNAPARPAPQSDLYALGEAIWRDLQDPPGLVQLVHAQHSKKLSGRSWTLSRK